MDPETQSQIETTVIEILKNADMEEMTEFKVRSAAAEKLGLDLSTTEYKRFVRRVVESFLLAKKEKEEANEAQGEEGEEEEEEDTKRDGGKEYDDDGDLIICRLSNKRRVTIQDFRGKTLVSIREFYEKDGKQMPSAKGISLTAEQWTAFSKSVPAIEEAIKKLESRLN
ncbi:RNA polymerase II transcriptional coactivator KELP [Magnolia sinica]|uniref:RNA polymerase II transcriptional coactivator KELP n=1 Tax=Magnolia sinica TaxID=86752 RepID=UPI002658DBF9|nr:RNA polymerase II transcriptional coactivator KELP [Magnolia sinica]